MQSMCTVVINNSTKFQKERQFSFDCIYDTHTYTSLHLSSLLPFFSSSSSPPSRPPPPPPTPPRRPPPPLPSLLSSLLYTGPQVELRDPDQGRV